MLKNIFQNIPSELPEELFETLLERPGLRIERIISKGHSTPDHEWYDQAWDEWILLVQGRAELGYADHRRINLGVGDIILIPAHSRHRVINTAAETETIWLAIHFQSHSDTEHNL
jgi:cupin 2 domain-containing protein